MNASAILVRRIQSERDAAASRRIRETVFVVEQQVPAEIEYDEFENQSTHVLALSRGKALGTARWRRTEAGFKLERFAVLRDARGQGVGAALLRFILDQLEHETEIYLNSQISALGFYLKFGFVAQGEIFYEAGIPHRRMIYKAESV